MPISVPALNPVGEGEVEYLIREDLIERLVKYFPRNKFLMLKHGLVHLVMKSPDAIFQGVRPDDKWHQSFNEEESYAYCGKPSFRITDEEKPASVPPDMLLMVVVSGREVFNWFWVPRCSETPRYPVDWDTRFSGGLLWERLTA